MRILFFYQYFGTPKGSWSTRVYELTRRWVSEGHDVTVITAPYEKSDIEASGFISRKEIKGVELIIINSGDSNRLSFIKRVIRAITFSLVSCYYALSRTYDLLIASSGPMTIGLPLIFAKVLRRKKTVFEVRDLWPSGAVELGLIKGAWQKRLAFWFEKRCYRNADLVITSSKGQLKHILARFPGLNTGVIPNASDLDLFGIPSCESLPEWLENKKLFTHIGSLGLIHNVDYWIDVAAELEKINNDQNIQLVFIGDGADRGRLMERISNLNLGNIKLLGPLPKQELPVWVQNSVATLFATLSNPVQDTCSPNKVFDSFAAGVPVIQTTQGWIAELVEQENCGINVTLDSPSHTARVILELSGDSAFRSQLSHNASRLAKAQFDRDLLSHKYLEHLEKVLLS